MLEDRSPYVSSLSVVLELLLSTEWADICVYGRSRPVAGRRGFRQWFRSNHSWRFNS